MAFRLQPFRDIDDHEIVNLYAFDGSAADAGSIVKIKAGEGWNGTLEHGTVTIGQTYGNTTSPRWTNPARVVLANSGDRPLGLLLAEVAESDENSQQYIFGRRNKATEKDHVLSGETVPILLRGTVMLDSGIINGFPSGGDPAYVGDNGFFNHNTGATGALSDGSLEYSQPVGMFLGSHDGAGNVAIHVNFQ